MLVKQIMSKKVIAVNAHTKLRELARIFKRHRINGVPVVDNKGAVIGIITKTDLLRMLKDIHFLKEVEDRSPQHRAMKECLIKEKNRATVRMKMTKQVWTVEEDSTIDYVLELMCKHNIHTIPVFRNRKMVGIVGATDMLNACI